MFLSTLSFRVPFSRASRIYPLVSSGRSGKGGYGIEKNVLLHLGKVARSYLTTVSNHGIKTHAYSRGCGRDLLPLPVRRAFWLRWAGGRGWTCRFRRWFGGALGNFGDAATRMRLRTDHLNFHLVHRLVAYLIALSYQRHVFVHESIAAFGAALSLKTFSFFSCCFYGI